MVAGATGIDLYLMVVAADDGVMPQTREHAARARRPRRGGRRRGRDQGRRRRPRPRRQRGGDCSRRPRVVAVLGAHRRRRRGRARAPSTTSRAAFPTATRAPATPLLHVDRAFTIRGAGTVVTGTLWAGRSRPATAWRSSRPARRSRVRAVQIHDEPVERAARGPARRRQPRRRRAARRRARRRARRPGAVAPSRVLDCDADAARRPPRRCAPTSTTAPARRPAAWPTWATACGRRASSSRLLARAGDRVVVRSIAPPDTLGGGVVLDPAARRHGRRDDVARAPGAPAPRRAGARARAGPRRRRRARPQAAPAPLAGSALALEERLRAAGHEPPNAADLEAERPRRAARRRARRARGPRDVRPPRGAGGRARPGRGRHRRRRRDHAGPPARRAADLAQVRPGAASSTSTPSA